MRGAFVHTRGDPRQSPLAGLSLRDRGFHAEQHPEGGGTELCHFFRWTIFKP
jgi:hypothetical protein